MSCPICSIRKEEAHEVGLLYLDKKVGVLLSPNPSSYGHIIIYPREHYVILEQIPDNIIHHILLITQKFSAILLDIVKTNSFNILIQNGIAADQKIGHFTLHIIPRYENDNINFQWQNQEFDQETLNNLYNELKKDLTNEKQQEKEEQKPKKDIKNDVIYQLKRMP